MKKKLASQALIKSAEYHSINNPSLTLSRNPNAPFGANN